MRYGVYHRARRRHRVFLLFHARKAIMKIIGQIEIRFRLFRLARAHVVVQLVHRIVLRELNPRFLIKSGERQTFVHGRNRIFRTPVAITIRVADDLVVAVEQHVIHAPRINPHACGNFADFFRFFQAVQNFGIQPVYIPRKPLRARRSERARRSRLFHGAVLKTIDFLRLQYAVFQSAQNMPPGRSPYIDRQIIRLHPNFLLFATADFSFLRRFFFRLYYIISPEFCLYPAQI